MMASYWWRLAWLALACLFVIHLAASAAVALLAHRAVQLAGRLQARSAARTLFLLRILPAIFSLLAVAAICVPSYLWLEPSSAHEQVGWICVAAALLAVFLWLDSASRFVGITVRSNRHMRRWRREAHPDYLGETAAPAYVIPSDVPFLALAGILQPRLIASRGILRALSSDQLTAAVHHEHAHRRSQDNLKRLILYCVPGLPPFRSSFDAIDQAWAKFAERAADDRAVSGNSDRALLLAEALVRVARIQAPQPALVAPLLADRSELHTRVHRLLNAAPAPSPAIRRWHLLAPAVLVVLIAGLLEPAALRFAHQLLEKLIR